MPRRVSIPEEHQALLREMVQWTDAQEGAVCSALEAISVPSSPKAIQSAIQQSLQVDETKALGFAQILFSILVSARSTTWSTTEVIEATAETTLEDVALAPKLVSRLKRLIDVPVVERTGRSHWVQGDVDKSFADARILSDIRAVFADDPAREVLGAVLIHNLRLSYFENGQLRDIYMSLDKSDLGALKKAIVRAESKTENLERLLRAFNVLNLETQESE